MNAAIIDDAVVGAVCLLLLEHVEAVTFLVNNDSWIMVESVCDLSKYLWCMCVCVCVYTNTQHNWLTLTQITCTSHGHTHHITSHHIKSQYIWNVISYHISHSISHCLLTSLSLLCLLFYCFLSKLTTCSLCFFLQYLIL